MTDKKIQRCLWVFGMNLFISSFTFGGGYVVVPMIRKYYVEKKHLFTEEELLNMAAVAQSSPGAIAINLASLTGLSVAGVPGAVLSCLAAVTPPIVILSIVSVWYTLFSSNTIIAAVLGGMEAGVAAMMVDYVADMCMMILKERSLLLTAIIPISFLANFVFGVNVALILVFSCTLCAARLWWAKRGRRREEPV